MNLDELISKYIDGELSQEEDFTLRRTLKYSPELREYFDDYIELHHSLQEDKYSITVPQDLYKRTEEAVLMKIFANAPNISAKIIKPKRKYSYQLLSMVAMIPILILISIFNVSDKQLNSVLDAFSRNGKLENKIISDEITNNNVVLSNNTATINNITKRGSEKKQLFQVNDNNSVDLSENTNLSEYNDLNNFTVTESSPLDVANLEVLSSNIDLNDNSFADKNLINLDNNLSSTNNNSFSRINAITYDNLSSKNVDLNNMLATNSPLSNILISSGQITAIQLTTSISQDFARSGIATSGNSSIFSMSQSLGYDINDDNSFGIEFGLMEMQYDYRKFVQIDPDINSPSLNQINTPIESGSSPRIFLPINLENRHQLIFGLAFYNAKIFDYGNLSLTGRLGLGATDDGPIGMSRLVAKYKLFDGVVLNAGLEGKLFVIKTPLLNNLSNTVSSIGLVYGVQFNI